MVDPLVRRGSPRQRGVRFEATVHRGPRQLELREIPRLDLDWMPSPPGEARVVISVEEAAELVERGFEVHLHQALPVRPLDPALVVDDEAARAELDDRFADVERAGEE